MDDCQGNMCHAVYVRRFLFNVYTNVKWLVHYFSNAKLTTFPLPFYEIALQFHPEKNSNSYIYIHSFIALFLDLKRNDAFAVSLANLKQFVFVRASTFLDPYDMHKISKMRISYKNEIWNTSHPMPSAICNYETVTLSI